ncbi:MAG: ATP-binding cassette domain-containing protein [Clostridia bacterium]|nr:ATP-binding cassette domain-containing protein [Clostridia bacterium]
MELELRGISKSFGEKKVLDDVSFVASSGRAFGLLGRNGAGKTTTIRIVMDVFPADSGEVLIDGSPIDYSKIGTGYLPEERGLYPKKPIDEQLLYFARLKGMNRTDATRAIDYWLDRLDMAAFKQKKLQTLSKGNQQKIQLITAVAHDPDLIVLDEPFSGLDPVNAGLLKSVVEEEIEKGKIVLFSSHQMNYIEEFCDHIAILNRGSLVLEGSLREIKRSYPRTTLTVTSPEIGRIAAAFGGEPTGDALTLKLRDEAEKRSVMQKLAADYEIDGVSVFEPSLADIFVEYAGDAC